MTNRKERNWKTRLLAIMLCVCIALPAAAAPGPYVRSDAVAEQEKGLTGKQKKDVSPLAWRKINGVCYNGSGQVIPGAITRGIDVSSWQETIDWKKVKNSDVDFAIIRLIHGIDYVDSLYDYNMKNATANGIPVGIYVYSKAKTVAEAVSEARFAIKKVTGYKISYPIVFDMEDDVSAALTTELRTSIVIAFCEEIKKAGYYPMVYTNISWYLTKLNMSKLKDYDVWLARYGDTINKPDQNSFRYTIWQATGGDTTPGMNPTKGLIDGIPTWNNADIDFGFVDYTKIIQPRTAPLASYTTGTASVKNGWITENGQKYYYVNGTKVKGARKIGKYEYRFAASDGHLYTNTLLYSSKTKDVVYCSSSGALLKKRWVSWKGKRYYLGNDYLAYKGSRNVNGKFYWFDRTAGFMRQNVKLITSGGGIYYYGNDGARVNSGFTKIKENGKINTYYFNRQGVAYKGWHKIGSREYYFYPGKNSKSGVRAENTTITIGNQKCTFDKNGVCIKKINV
ncbi:MAG: hypothetical protein IJ123_06900 [Blautia sp.]|nr:hypothetical protein [Blautia sp.]